MLHTEFIRHLESVCSEIENKPSKLRAYEKIYGGDINEAYRLAMTDSDYFIKINMADKLKMFQTEATSLKILADTNSFVIPKINQTGVFESQSYLLTSFILTLQDTSNAEDFAQNLAKLHQTTQAEFGLNFDNFIGELPQKNAPKKDWTDFYIENRLQFQLDIAKQQSKVPSDILKSFDKLFAKLPEIFPNEPPALLHGDLWKGNYFYNLQGKAVVFDPAIYYGHREMDLAMMRLFGGFDDKIFEIYQSLFPLEKGWQARVAIAQLYPLLVHANLFGDAYWDSIASVLKKYK